jgi:Protein of unknown function (DUF3365)
MTSNSWCALSFVMFCFLTAHIGAAESETSDKKEQAENSPKPAPSLTVAEARRHAKLLHNTYEATLHTVHREYFREGGRTPIPARVLEEVFYWVDEETQGETRWIAVNTEAMSIDHNAETEFEKKAVKELSKGKEEFEQIEDGMYRRVGAVTLFASCLRCHESALTQLKTKRRVAGLVINLPIRSEPAKK